MFQASQDTGVRHTLTDCQPIGGDTFILYRQLEKLAGLNCLLAFSIVPGEIESLDRCHDGQGRGRLSSLLKIVRWPDGNLLTAPVALLSRASINPTAKSTAFGNAKKITNCLHSCQPQPETTAANTATLLVFTDP